MGHLSTRDAGICEVEKGLKNKREKISSDGYTHFNSDLEWEDEFRNIVISLYSTNSTHITSRSVQDGREGGCTVRRWTELGGPPLV